ncbi:MAG: Rrf2 family transcriptional regulator [Rhodococcus sp.]|nr:Rrf2 family transcriptional regulator [Rhodococcus sp. (in: high G+C Gram-positive bacteria)]
MQLSRFTDLGLRAMMLLSVRAASEERVTTRMIARQVNASEHHVAKAVTRLVDLGLVASQRGRAGGLFITESGQTVSIGWLVRRMEGEGDVVQCEGDHPCPLVGACRLRGALARAQEAFFRELDRYTLDQVASTKSADLLHLFAHRERVVS